MAQGLTDNVNIFAPEKDILDRAVEGYEENVPLVGQIAAGFTPPGMAMDVVAAGKYGRDAVGELASMVAQVPYTLEYGVRGEIRTKERMKIEVFTGTTIHHVFKHYTSHTRYSDNGSLVAE